MEVYKYVSFLLLILFPSISKSLVRFIVVCFMDFAKSPSCQLLLINTFYYFTIIRQYY